MLLLLGWVHIKGQANCMQIGVGLEGPAYWANGENAFIDQMKYRGGWITYNATGSSPWDTHLDQEIPLDGDGYPNAGIPYLTSGGLQKVRIVVSASNRVPLGQYAFLYDGYGEFSFYGFTVDTVTPGRIVVTVTGTGNVWMHMDSSSVAPNQARNFRLVPLAQEATYQSQVFRQPFLDRLAPFYAVRFMDWFHTNNSPIISWPMRSRPQSYSQADSAGICYEYAIDLCNRTGKHPWVNIPHMADSIYITRMAELWRDSLDPSLHVYVEYSNETWNWQFLQAQWNIQNTTWLPSHWPLNPMYDPGQNFGYNSGKHSAQVFRIWRRVWGADSLRVVRVLGTQAVWPQAVSVGNVEGCGRQYDYLSPTWYFGLSTTQSANFGAGTTPEQVIDTCRNNFFVNIIDEMKMHYVIADTTGGKGVIHYEGGQHISAYGNASHPALQAFYDAQNHPDMYDLYDDVLDSIREWGSELAMAFVLGGRDSQHGSWGHIRSVDSTPSMLYSPKYMALLDNILPIPQPDLGQDTSFCDGQSVTLDGGAGFVSWLWNDGSTAQTVIASQTGQYNVEVVDGWGCVGSDTIQVVANALPQPSFGSVSLGMTVNFSSPTPNIVSWLYDFGDGSTDTSAAPSHLYAVPGWYQVCLTVVDANGCQGQFCDSLLVNPTGVEVGQTLQWAAWPNPVQESLAFEVPAHWFGGSGSVAVWDALGALVDREYLAVPTGTLALSGLPNGIYWLVISNAQGQSVSKAFRVMH